MLVRTDRMAPSAEIFPHLDPEFCHDEYLKDVLENRFCFNGETHDLGSQIDWLTNPSADVEWHISLHKCYYAVGLAEHYRAHREPRVLDHLVQMIESWISTVPVGFIATDVTGRRVQNWIYAWYLLRRCDAPLSPEFETALLASIAQQVGFIIEHLAPARNHRTLELYTVFLAAVALPAEPRTAAWLKFSVAEMVRNMESDILPDGVHCELSSGYHHIVLKNYLLFYRLAEANGISLPTRVRRILVNALRFALFIQRPDGDIPALSDSDSQSYRFLLQWGAELFQREDLRFGASGGVEGRPPAAASAVFPHGGYCVLRDQWQPAPAFEDCRYLVFDCGPIGAGNHGHLDALSVEVAAYGRPLIVDPGRYTYDEAGPTNWRARFRGTAAHSTVCINGHDQAIYRQSGKRHKVLTPHPRTRLVRADLETAHPWLHGQTTSPNYDAVHARHILFAQRRYWWIVDALRSATTSQFDQRFQLDAAAYGTVQVVHHSGAVEVQAPGLQILLLGAEGTVDIEASWIASRYGVRKAAPLVSQKQYGGNVSMATLLLPHRGVPIPLRLETETHGVRCWIENAESDEWFWNQMSGVLELNQRDAWHFCCDEERSC